MYNCLTKTEDETTREETNRNGEKTMFTKTIDVQTRAISLNDVVSLIRQGNDILVTDANIPLACIIPWSKSNAPRIAGLHAGAIWTSDDFDEPLPDEFWTGRL
jgi:antitoxin (DNA-binding transcriptional repressor) of toxin-antitoxin stability system